MTKKTMKKIIDDQPAVFFVLYKSTLHGKPVNSLLFEEQKNLCREALVKIFKEKTHE